MLSLGNALLVVTASLAAIALVQERRIQPAGKPIERHLALVIGNSAYPRIPLHNAENDARALAGTLNELGFRVQLGLDLDRKSLEKAVDKFINDVHAGDVALFYYSGHGVQVDEENYLIPIDFAATEEAEVKYQSYSASEIHDRMQQSGARLNIIILDACRDNPFKAIRSGSGGWAPMATGRGTLIAFATAPGATASDNPNEKNGLFTKYLLAVLDQPGLNLTDVFDRVREEVDRASNHRQLPYTVSSVIGSFMFRDPEIEMGRIAAEEVALQEQLKKLQADEEDARKRNAEREAQAKEREAAALRSRLEFEHAERERVQGEIEKAARSNTGSLPVSDWRAREQAEQGRLAELRRQAEVERARLSQVQQADQTIDEAKRNVGKLNAEIELTQAELDRAKNKAIHDLEESHTATLTKLRQNTAKDMFETTTAYELRLNAEKQQEQDLRQKYDSERADIVKRYAAEVDEETKPYREQVASLNRHLFRVDASKFQLRTYDADQQVLFAYVNGTTYAFPLTPAIAKSLYARKDTLEAEQSPDQLTAALRDPLTSQPINAIPLASRGTIRINHLDNLQYVWIPAGKFVMGCVGDCPVEERNAHQVVLTKGFWIGRTEVTQEAYERVIHTNPSNPHGLRLPVERVTWDEARNYCAAVGMRLPTEAEWEYAARDGLDKPVVVDAMAWYGSVKRGKVHEVAQKQGNGYGLFDVLGNVWEWTSDWYSLAYYVDVSGLTIDPEGPSTGEARALRGGSYLSHWKDLRASVWQITFRFDHCTGTLWNRPDWDLNERYAAGPKKRALTPDPRTDDYVLELKQTRA